MTVAITKADQCKLRALATSGLEVMIASFLKDRTGGFLYLQDASGECWMHLLFGIGSEEKRYKWQEFSREKAHRLATHPTHQLSWQSRKPDNDQWGGSIRLPNGFILSFSGLPEWADEVFCAALAVRMGWATVPKMLEVLSISGNDGELLEIMAMIPKAQAGG